MTNQERHRALIQFHRTTGFSPVIELPEDYEIYDFSAGYDPNRPLTSPFGIGRYNEKRPGMYSTELFDPGSPEARDHHIGIDIGAPAGTPVRAFSDGIIFMKAINSAPGDYGGTLITEHTLDQRKIWALHGHLSHESVRRAEVGRRIGAGEIIAWLGEQSENGGWNPHLHFQLSRKKPDVCDLPGVVHRDQVKAALETYPDPRIVLGPLYL